MTRSLLPLLFGAALVAACGDGPAPGPADAAGAATPARPAAPDWSQTVVRTAEGGFRMGNPDAPVKLVEYASFTCSHCQRFHLEGAEALKTGLVKAGRVSYEFRPFFLNPIDVAATLVAVCNGPQQFFTWVDQLYRNHDSWVTPFTKLTDRDLKPLNALPQDQQVKRLAELGGLDAFVRPRGMPRARFDQCLTDAATLNRLLDQQRTAMERDKVQATPTLFLNGRKLDGVTTWADLRPRIEAALG
ncbi:MAG: DsbA family protein [Sphingomonadaceae bacterium]|uniref:thioredoxin domain-containing protein n=1 Tax=Thermaurantiacus sp. TaxID=2820283 RepID=UPI00298EFA40|nr:thioredoxin domain-containing protein [Thermaurantiacus sp.]MCS6987871.1 DsbA family protein [Sphingomonadaceae bacterium]MDW8414909.1 thioredoxin domain-containing protein [Thermaurantiacus sp.]